MQVRICVFVFRIRSAMRNPRSHDLTAASLRAAGRGCDACGVDPARPIKAALVSVAQATAKATARPQAPGAQRRSSAEDAPAQAGAQSN